VRVLLLGAYGFIGSAIAHELTARGHEVIGLGRDVDYGRRILPQVRWVRTDLRDMTAAESWRPLLIDVDAVVNASGLLQSGEGGTVEAIQLQAVRALIQACEDERVSRFVQISAAGARPDANSDFMATKGRADALIAGSSVKSLILRPGLVIGRNSYGGTELIRMAAALPLRLRMPFEAPIQCVALSDVMEAVAIGLAPNAPVGQFDLVERQAHPLDAIVSIHRQWLGLPKPKRSLPVPSWSLALASRISDFLGHLGWRSPLRRNAVLALEGGVQGDSDQAATILRREPTTLEEALARQPSGKQDRLQARLAMVQPLILASLFIMWSMSGVATLLQLDRAEAILKASGMDGQSAEVFAAGGAWLDIVLAGGLLWRRTVRGTLLTMMVLTIFAYLIGGTVLLPDLWFDPLAPLAKALPATMLALVAFWLVEKR
jgi:uncharacterized protein YbjT (DUF2867 family)